MPEVEVAVVQGAEQAVAFVELQESVDEPPVFIVEGLAVKVTVGFGSGLETGFTIIVAVEVALPPAPVQVIE